MEDAFFLTHISVHTLTNDESWITVLFTGASVALDSPTVVPNISVRVRQKRTFRISTITPPPPLKNSLSLHFPPVGTDIEKITPSLE